MTISLAASPYFDDYDHNKGFHKILFHPAKPVQARELTQIQSILQNQVKMHGDHIFKNGTIVVPGHIFYDNSVTHLKLDTIYNNTNIESYLDQIVGQTIIGDTNGISAIVLHYDIATATDPTTLYIKYITAAGSASSFLSGETLTFNKTGTIPFKIQSITDYTGQASICTINDGIFYVNGYFVEVLKQTATVSKYSNTTSIIMGLEYVESIITEHDDDSLFDNAYGFSNYTAPGAHRLQISLTVGTRPYDYVAQSATEINFIDVLKIKDGSIEYLNDKTQYSEVEKLLARRTYDESGDYVTKPFSFSASNYRNSDRGIWVTNTPYLAGDIVSNAGLFYVAINSGYSGVTNPVHLYGQQSDGSIYWNQIQSKTGFTNGGTTLISSSNIQDHKVADSQMSIRVSTGKAYVNGFENELSAPTTVIANKARTLKQISQSQLYAPTGSYVTVDNLQGMINVSSNLTQLSILDFTNATIGIAWARALEYSSGVMTSTAAQYNLFLFGISMNANKSFVRDAQSFASSGVFSAQIVPTLTAISGSASTSGSSTTVTGLGTYFNYDLGVGSRIKVGSSFTSVSSITSPVVLVSTTAITAAAGSTIYACTSPLTKIGDYITNMPFSAINTLRTSIGSIDMLYQISKSYDVVTTSGVTTWSYTLSNGETFLPSGHIIRGTNAAYPSGVTIDISPTGDTITISNLTPTLHYPLLALQKRTGAYAREKTKSLTTYTLTVNDTGTQTFNSKTIMLPKADCIRLIKVVESGSPTEKTTYVASGETDVTKYFTFNGGQTAEYYGLGIITSTRSNTRPLRITFDYFEHSAGDYFSVDSYTSVPKSLIPLVSINGTNYLISDCLDFRSRISSSGLNFDTAGGASICDPLTSNQTISTSYSYYLPRFDSIAIDTSGAISYHENSMSLSNGMTLCTLGVKPFTSNPQFDCIFQDVQVTSYKMTDIKDIDNRLSNVEYYVVTSNLEKSTLNTSITDQNGLQVDKNGYVVDDFTNHDISDTTNGDYKASIDIVNNNCQALQSINGVIMMEPVNTTDSTRLANGYQLTNSSITLPYIEVALISQLIPTRAENIQPYLNISFNGFLKLTPATDNYADNFYDKIVKTDTLLNGRLTGSSTSTTSTSSISNGSSPVLYY